MFKWIFLAQAIVYFLVMPVLRGSIDKFYEPPLGVGVLAVLSLYAGYLFCRMQGARTVEGTPPSIPMQLQPRIPLGYAIPAFATLYAVTVLAYGLLNRRQGSEFMAELYADLPVYVLAIVRGYEILFVPLVLLYAFGGSKAPVQQRIVGLALLASLPFMGIVDSRGRLIILAIYILCLVRMNTFVQLLYKYVRFYLAALIVVGAFLFYSFQRSVVYASFNEYLLAEVYQRLDGLNLVTDLRDAGVIDGIGQFDFAMFGPLLSKIPFLEVARTAKLAGRTSTKQYYIQDLLGSQQLDAPNSMIADPLYFAGWFGIIVAFCLIGYIIARIDRFITRDGLFRYRNKTAIVIAFVTSFAMIEQDLMGSVASFAQNYILVVLLLAFGTAREWSPVGEMTLTRPSSSAGEKRPSHAS